MNFGYTFGMPRSEQDGGSNVQGNAGEGQNEYSIDLSKIEAPATFRFGQFGQVPPTSDGNVEDSQVNNDDTGDNTGENAHYTHDNDNYTHNTADNTGYTTQDNFDDISFDDDSFLAEPSISAGQFDATFNFHPQTSNSAESLESGSSARSVPSVPVLVEEPLQTPTYLEKPPVHTVEDMLKANVDGDTTKVMSESWENVGAEEIQAIQEEFARIQEAELHAVFESESVVPEPEPVEKVTEPGETETVEIESANVPEPKAEALTAESEAEAEPVPVKPVKKPAKETVKKVAKAPAKPRAKKVPEVVVIEAPRGKRERKTVERLADTVAPPVKKVVEKIPTIPSGSGVKLGEIELILQNINKKASSDKSIIGLHRLLFDRMGEARHRKVSLRAWCGQDDAKFESKLQKYTKVELVELATFLGLTSANEKADIIARIANFLVKPSKEAVKFTAAGERITKKPSVAAKKKAALEAAKPKPTRSSKRKAPEPSTTEGAKTRKPYTKKKAAKTEFLTPETVDSDTENEEA